MEVERVDECKARHVAAWWTLGIEKDARNGEIDTGVL